MAGLGGSIDPTTPAPLVARWSPEQRSAKSTEKPLDPRAFFEQCAKELQRGASAERRGAVRKLAELGTPAAFDLVLQALADAESAVADQAQIDLPRAREEAHWKAILGRQGLEAKEQGVRWRSAELIGRAARSFDAERLARALDRQDPELSLRLCASIEALLQRRAIQGKHELLARTLLELSRAPCKEPLLPAAALAAWSRCVPAHVDGAGLEAELLEAESRRAFDRGSTPLRLAALEISLRHRFACALEQARRLSLEIDPLARSTAFDALGEVGSRAAATSLLAGLEEERIGWVRARAVAGLQRLSGMKYGSDPRPWKLWLDGLAADWEGRGFSAAASAPAAHAKAAPGASTSGGLMGLDLESERVCFLFDLSGSMAQELDGGTTPKSIVGEHLDRALRGLRPGVRFNLIPFSTRPMPWQERLVEATPQQVRRALEFFGACRAGGRGNFFDAFLLAWNDPQVDRLVVLTDGVPTGGFHSDMDLIAPLILFRARFRPVVLDAVLVDASGGSVRRWRDLCEQSGGRVVQAALKR